MNVVDAYNFIAGRALADTSRFYGSHEDLPLGAGLICKGIRVPFFNEKTRLFQTIRSVVYVMTHECDIDQKNVRPFNDDVLVCPMMLFEKFVELYNVRFGENRLPSFLDNLGRREVSRLMYFPPLGDVFEYGAVMFLNAVCSTKVEVFHYEEAGTAGALSEFGLREVDFTVTNHLLRPKQQPLGLSR